MPSRLSRNANNACIIVELYEWYYDILCRELLARSFIYILGVPTVAY